MDAATTPRSLIRHARPHRSALRLFLSLLLIVLFGCDANPPEAPAPRFVTELSETLVAAELGLEGAVLSLWSAGDESTWFAGGTSSESGGFVLRYSQNTIRPENIPAGPLLWWITGANQEHLWAVGDRGRILARGPDGWVDETPTLDEKAILYGAWAAATDDVWAVGGSIRRGGPKGLVLRSRGDGAWERISDDAFPDDLNLYKVWGRGPDDVFLVGEGGVVIHWDGEQFSRQDTGHSSLLFTVHGQKDGLTLAVGGLMRAAAFSEDGSQWTGEFPEGAPGLNGVFVRSDGMAVATGNRGATLVRTENGRWYPVRPRDAADIGGRTLHAVWSDETTWAVGGDLSSMSDGVILTTRRPVPRVEME